MLAIISQASASEPAYTPEAYSFVRIFEQAQADEKWTETTTVSQRLLLIRTKASANAVASSPISDRYMVTCYGGTLDLVHFLALAAEAAAGTPTGKRLYKEWVAEGGQKNRYSFNWSEPPEAHPDDLPSNALGSLFGWQLRQADASLETNLLAEFSTFTTPLIPVPDSVAKTFSHREIVMGFPPENPPKELVIERHGWFTAVPYVQTQRLNEAALRVLNKPICENVESGEAALAKAHLKLHYYQGKPIMIVPE